MIASTESDSAQCLSVQSQLNSISVKTVKKTLHMGPRLLEIFGRTKTKFESADSFISRISPRKRNYFGNIYHENEIICKQLDLVNHDPMCVGGFDS